MLCFRRVTRRKFLVLQHGRLGAMSRIQFRLGDSCTKKARQLAPSQLVGTPGWASCYVLYALNSLKFLVGFSCGGFSGRSGPSSPWPDMKSRIDKNLVHRGGFLA